MLLTAELMCHLWSHATPKHYAVLRWYRMLKAGNTEETRASLQLPHTVYLWLLCPWSYLSGIENNYTEQANRALQ